VLWQAAPWPAIVLTPVAKIVNGKATMRQITDAGHFLDARPL
jgi:hypothetical protein